MILMYTNPIRPLKELLTLCLYKGPSSQIFYFFENRNLKQARVYAYIIDHSKLYQKEEEESAHFLQTLSLSLYHCRYKASSHIKNSTPVQISNFLYLVSTLMAGSTSVPPNTSIQLDHAHCSNPHQLNQKDQSSSTVESYLVQPSTPSPPPPSNSAPNQLHLPLQNLSTLPPPPPPNLGFAEHIIPQASEPSPPIPSSLGRNHNQVNHNDPTSTALQPNWGSTQPITGPYHQQPSPVSFQNPRAEPNLAIQNHVPWSLQWILRIDPSNLLPQIQDFNNQQSPAAISAVKVQPSEPITYNLNLPAIFVVSSNSQPNISAEPPSQSSNPPIFRTISKKTVCLKHQTHQNLHFNKVHNNKQMVTHRKETWQTKQPTWQTCYLQVQSYFKH